MSGIEKKLTIDGSMFSDIDSFYGEIERIFTKGLKWKTGHNLNAFDDLLRDGLVFLNMKNQ